MKVGAWLAAALVLLLADVAFLAWRARGTDRRGLAEGRAAP